MDSLPGTLAPAPRTGAARLVPAGYAGFRRPLHLLVLALTALLIPDLAAQAQPVTDGPHALRLLNAEGRGDLRQGGLVRFLVHAAEGRIVGARLLTASDARPVRGPIAAAQGRDARRVQGTETTGIWEAVLPAGFVEAGSALVAEVRDEAGRRYVYPVEDAAASKAGGIAEVVVGTVTITPETVDNATDQTVRADVQLTSTLELLFVTLELRHSNGEDVHSGFATLVSGTETEGTWRSDIELPAFARPGTYALVVSSYDGTAFEETPTGRSVTVTGATDTAAPALNGTASVDPASVDVSGGPQEVSVSVPLRDDVSGIENIQFYFENGTDFLDGGDPVLASGTNLDGTWSATAEIPQSAPSGTYNLYVYATDQAGNDALLNTGRTLTVGGGDAEAPAIAGTSTVDPTSVDVEAGPQTVVVEVTLEDPSGVEYVLFSLQNDSESIYGGDVALISGDALSGRWRGEIEVPQNTEAGSWAVAVEAQDALGNYDQLSTGLTVQVGGGDVLAPTLAGTPTLAPSTITLVDEPQTVVVDIPVQDDATGVSNVDFQFRNGSTTISAGVVTLVSGTAMNGTWRGEIEFPLSTEEGEWELVVYVQDVAGNNATLNTGEFLTVQGGDTDAPVVSGPATVEPGTVDLTTGDQTVTATVPLQDDQSGVQHVTLALRAGSLFVGSATATRISGDSLSGVWQAEITIPRRTADGVLNLSVSPTDHAGNFETHTTGATVTVSGGDVTGPVLNGTVAVSPAAVSVGGGPANVTVAVPLQDPASGVSSVSIQLLPLEGSGAVASTSGTRVSGTATDGTWQGVLSVPQRTAEGEYRVVITAWDVAGNSVSITAETRVQVSDGDVTPPELAGTASVDPAAVDLTGGDQTVTASVLLRDAGTGVASVGLRLVSVDGNHGSGTYQAALASGTAQEGTWQGTITIHQDLPPGEYRLVAAATDNAFNSSADLSTEAFVQVTIQAPGLVSNPTPADGEVDIPERPVLGWQAAEAAVSYDLYLWRAGQARPNAPYASDLHRTNYTILSDTLAYGAEYEWQVVAKNTAAATPGPVWRFGTRRLADLVVTRIELPPDVLARQFVDLEWVVTNTGAVGTTAPRWTDDVYLSSDTILVPQLDVRLGSFYNPAHLPAGESYEQRQRVQIPDRVFGDLYVLIKTNSVSQGAFQEESNFDNNLTNQPVHVTLPPPPDLVTTSFIVPEQVFSGREFEVSWTVENRGTGSTYRGAWDDSLYVSPDSVLTRASAVYKTRYRRILDIEPDSSYTASLMVELPAELSGTYYVHLKLDALDYVFEPGGEDNNYSRRPLEVTLSPPPDLVVSGIQAAGALTSGNPVAVSWTVTNEGPGDAAGSWSDRVYVSSEETFNLETAKVLGTFSSLRELARDSSYTQRQQVVVPDGVEGTQYLFVQTDLAARVFEGPFEGNNTGRGDAVAVSLSPWADLRVSAVDVTGGARAGDEVSILYEVTNAGEAGARPAWTDSVYVSTNAAWDRSTARPIGVARRMEALPEGGTYVQAVATRLPNDLSGTLYVYVMADAGANVYEHSGEADNVLRSDASEVGAYPPVDLTVTALEAPANVVAGSTVALSYTVRNGGEAPTVVTAWEDVIYLSLDGSPSPGTDTRLLEVARSQRLEGAESYTRTVEVKVPDGISGTYRFVAVADATNRVAEVDDDNNFAASGAVAVTLGGIVDLQVIGADVPGTLVAGQPAVITWTVRNAGGSATTDTLWTDDVYLSQSADRALGSRLLATAGRRGGVAASGEYTGTATITVPTYTSGKYYLLISTDRTEQVYEHEGEGNNTLVVPVTVVQPPPSDLIVARVTVADTATVGNDVLVSWTLRNQSVNPASGQMTSGVYFSKDQTWDVDDPLLAMDTRQIEVAAGSSADFSAKVSLASVLDADSTGAVLDKMPGVLPGEYYALVRADLLNNIPESEEQNNTGASENTVDVSVPVLPLNTPVTRRWRHENSHYFAVDVQAGQDLRIRLTRHNSFSGGIAVAYGRMPSASAFDYATASLDGTVKEVLVPSTQAGRYYVMVKSDHLFFDEEDYTVLAEALGFSVASVSPERVGQGVVTTRLTGAGFRANTRVMLRTEGGEVVTEGTVVRRPNTTELAVRWDLGAVPLGTYTITAENESPIVASLPLALEVEPVRTPALEMVRTTPSALLMMRNTTYVFQFRNTSNVDIPYATISMSVRGSTALTVETDGRLMTRTMMEQNVGSELARPVKDYADVSGIRVVPLVVRDVEPGEALEARLSVVPASEGFERFPVTVRWQLQDRTVFAQEQLERIEKARQAVLANPNGVAAEFLQIAEDPQAFAQFVMRGLVQLGLLEESEIDDVLGLQTEVLRKMSLTADGLPGLSGPMMGGPVCSNLSAADAVNLGPVCEMIFTVTGCVAAVVDCFVDIPFIPLSAGASAALCVFGVSTACTGTDVGLAGCIGVFSAINCIAKELICDKLVFSLDPNDIIGPEGYGDKKWIGVNQTLPYTIRFENDPERATAPAQVVRITLPVDSTLDERSFRLGSFGFRNWRFDVPANASSYSTRLDLRDSIGIYVDVEAGIDVQTRRAFWTLRSVDPATGTQPNDPFAGFLAVNDSLGAGEGYVSYTIRPKSTSRTGDLARAEANIVFDLNEAIATPPIANTIDAGRPTSRVASTWEEVTPGQLRLSWTGADDDNGSGLREYALYVSQDNQPFQLHQSGLTGTEAVVAVDPQHTYRYFLLASDNAGNMEVSKTEGELVVGTASDSEAEAPEAFDLRGNYPNPFRQTTTVQYDVAQTSEVEFFVYDLLGRRVLQFKLGTVQPGRYKQPLDMSAFASGVYLFDMRVKSGGTLIFREAHKMVHVR